MTKADTIHTATKETINELAELFRSISIDADGPKERKKALREAAVGKGADWDAFVFVMKLGEMQEQPRQTRVHNINSYLAMLDLVLLAQGDLERGSKLAVVGAKQT